MLLALLGGAALSAAQADPSPLLAEFAAAARRLDRLSVRITIQSTIFGKGVLELDWQRPASQWFRGTLGSERYEFIQNPKKAIELQHTERLYQLLTESHPLESPPGDVSGLPDFFYPRTLLSGDLGSLAPPNLSPQRLDARTVRWADPEAMYVLDIRLNEAGLIERQTLRVQGESLRQDVVSFVYSAPGPLRLPGVSPPKGYLPFSTPETRLPPEPGGPPLAQFKAQAGGRQISLPLAGKRTLLVVTAQGCKPSQKLLAYRSAMMRAARGSGYSPVFVNLGPGGNAPLERALGLPGTPAIYAFDASRRFQLAWLGVGPEGAAARVQQVWRRLNWLARQK